MHVWPAKDPNEFLDYQVSWVDRLVTGETITASTFTVVSGDVTLSNPSYASGITTVWVASGTDGSTAEVLNRITTSAGRIYDETVKLKIRSK